MAVSIRDISRLAKVSTATVSRVLNDLPGVSDDERQRIRGLAASLGYEPNRFAQTLARGKSHLVGFVISELGNSDYVYYYRRIEDALTARGYRCLISDSRCDPAKEKANVAVMLQNRVEGLVIVPASDPTLPEAQALLADLRRRGVPFVVVGAAAPKSVDFVATEERSSAAALIRRLLALGHRRFAVVGLDPANARDQERLAGVRDALGAARKALHLESTSEPAWEDALRERLRTSDAPTTVLVTATDDVAALLYRHLRRWGVRVPRDLSVAALSASTWAALLDPPLVANWPDHGRIPDLAAELLLRRMGEPGVAAKSHRVPMRLGDGGSCVAVEAPKRRQRA